MHAESLFNLKFTAKQLSRQSKKAQKDEQGEKNKLKKALQQGNNDAARIYAANSIRKRNESLELLKLSSRLDAAASRVQTAVTMNQVSSSMVGVVKGMDKAMTTMNLERISNVMEKFEQQFEDLDVQTDCMQNSLASTTAVSTPQDEVDELMMRVADENGLELQMELPGANLSSIAASKQHNPVSQLEARLEGLRNM